MAVEQHSYECGPGQVAQVPRPQYFSSAKVAALAAVAAPDGEMQSWMETEYVLHQRQR